MFSELDVLILLIAPLSAIFFIMLLEPIASRIRLIDEPKGRKKHDYPVPIVGGVALYVIFICFAAYFNFPEKTVWMAISCGILVALGTLDDLFGLSVLLRLAVQVAASVVMILGSGLILKNLGADVFGTLQFPYFIEIVFTCLFVISLVNAFNFADGIDGLASAYAIVCCISLISLSMTIGVVIQHLEWVLIFSCSLLGFFIVNVSVTPLKKVFLGDAGSTLIGFIVGWALLYYSQGPGKISSLWVLLWTVSIPLFDMVVVTISRVAKGRSPFRGDRNHVHHLLIDAGLSQRQTLILLIIISCLFSQLGFQLHAYGLITSPIFGVACLILVVFIIRSHMFRRYVLLMLRLLRTCKD